ncbi:MAG: PD40 domain-containing protein [Bacteroidetes bacterium]|nr:PD40 domain-containing protein [Bacteroidota bacterium]
MKFRFTLFSFLTIICLVHPSFAQTPKSVYKDKVTEGNYLFLEKNYTRALENFLTAYQIDSTNANINYKIGLCYLNSSSEKLKAISYLEKASKKTKKNYDEYDPREKKAPKNVFLYLGQAYLVNDSLLLAKKAFTRFKGMQPERAQDEVKKYIETTNLAIKYAAEQKKSKIVSLSNGINTKYADYAPVINADESVLIFTSRREGSTGEEKTPDDDLYYEDIYQSKSDGKGGWTAPEHLNINTTGNDAAMSLSADGQTLFVYKQFNGGDIYVSNLNGDVWSEPEPLSSNVNSVFWEPHACVSADGNTLYFVSDRPGGLGGRDIYRSVKLPNGEWSLPQNLGPRVNTPADEDAPFIHPDGVTLFFSSNGHKGIGGFDIFYTVKRETQDNLSTTISINNKNNTNLEERKWPNPPVNLESPVNTTGDDIYYSLSADGKRAYISSARAGGEGEKDIYMVSIEQTVVEPTVLLRGYLTFDGKETAPGTVRIVATDLETGTVSQEVRPNTKTGKYLVILNPGQNGKTYSVSYEAEGYQSQVETIKVEPGSAFQLIDRALDLKPVNFESKTPGTIAMSGKITNKDKKVIPGSKIVVSNVVTAKVVDTYYANPTNGAYYFVLPRGENYSLSYEAEGYLFQSENISTPKEATYEMLNKDIVLNKLEVGSKIVLNNIFFDSGKSKLRSESNAELEKLYKIMSDNNDITVEISGHTDDQGKADMNLKLSQARAQAVVDYLANEKNKVYRVPPYYYKGIPRKRMTAKGYGSDQPIAPNKGADGKPDPKGMQLNRRVEFKVVSKDPSLKIESSSGVVAPAAPSADKAVETKKK